MNEFCLAGFWEEAGGCEESCLLCRYVPGPILKEGVNEIILLEVEKAPTEPVGEHPRPTRTQLTTFQWPTPVKATACSELLPSITSRRKVLSRNMC